MQEDADLSKIRRGIDKDAALYDELQ